MQGSTPRRVGSLLIPFLVLVLGLRPAAAANGPFEYLAPGDRVYALYYGFLPHPSPEVVPGLIELCSHPNSEIRRAAIGALGRSRDRRAIPTLDAIADDPYQEFVRGRNFRLQNGKLGDDPIYDLRTEARKARRRVPDGNGHTEAIYAIDELRRLDVAAVRRHGARRTAAEAREYDDSPLSDIDRETFERTWFAISHIGETNGPVGTRALLSVLGCDNPKLEWEAAEALVERPTADVLPLVRTFEPSDAMSDGTLLALVAVLAAHDADAARIAGLRLLGRLEGRTEFKNFAHSPWAVLGPALRPEDGPRLESLGHRLDDVQDRAAVAKLSLRIVDEAAARVHPLDFEHVDETNRAEVVAELRSALRSHRFETTLKACRLAGKHRMSEVVPELSALVGKSWAPQWILGRALCDIGDRVAIPSLRAAAMDEERYVWSRGPALIAYGRLGGPAAVADLATVFHRHHDQLREPRRIWKERRPLHSFLQFGWQSRDFARDQAESDFQLTSCRVAEATALGISAAGGDEARRILVAHLHSGRPVTGLIARAVHRVAPDALDEWSLAHCFDATPSAVAVDVRLSFFPEARRRVVAKLLRHPGGHSDHVIDRLQVFDVEDDGVTLELINLLTEHGGRVRNRRIGILGAIGRQGGELGQRAVLEYARKGRLQPREK